jgi:hypothetical protein
MVVAEAGGEVLRGGKFRTVELRRAIGGRHMRADDPLQVDLQRPFVECIAKCFAARDDLRDKRVPRFPTAGHLLAWAGMCPGQNESAGKRKSSRLRKGAPWLKTILVQCAWAATRKKDSYYGAQFKRLRAKRGPKKAICAVVASMLTAIYHMLKNGTHHQDLGADHFDRRSSEAKARHHVAQLARLGFHVELQPAAQAA